MTCSPISRKTKAAKGSYEMSDICDQGNDAAELFLDAALRQRERTPDGDPHGERECIDCGDMIPSARRLAAPWAARCRECEDFHQNELRLRDRL